MMKWGVQWFVFDDEIHKVPSMAELTERLRQEAYLLINDTIAAFDLENVYH